MNTNNNPSQNTPVNGPDDQNDANDPLGRLRGFRVYAQRARGLEDDMAKQMQTMKKISQAESAASEAWMTVAPDQVLDCTAISGLKAGKLIVLVPSAAHRYLVDRWLGSGGLGELQALARVPIRGIDIKIDTKTS